MENSGKINTAIALIVIIITAMVIYYISRSGAGDGSGGSGSGPGGNGIGTNAGFFGNLFGKKSSAISQTATAPAPYSSTQNAGTNTDPGTQIAPVSSNYLLGYTDGQTDARGGTGGAPPAPDGTNDYIDGYNLGYHSIIPNPTI
jgi:hypothetical protein